MIAEMIGSLDLTLAFIRDQVMDLTDEEMILQPAGFPNHAAWKRFACVSSVLLTAETCMAACRERGWWPGF